MNGKQHEIKKPVAVVLGGTNPHKALIENLNKRGYHTVLIDYLASPPAREAAGEHIRKSALDSKEVLEACKACGAGLVISAGLDKTIPVVAEVASVLKLPSIYTPENARWFTDKDIMKQMMQRHDILTPKYRMFGRDEEACISEFSLPVTIKPADGTGSLGITVVREGAESKPAVVRAREASTTGKVLVEEYTNGREFSIDCFVTGGKAEVLLVRERFTQEVRNNGSIQCYATITPAHLTEEENRLIQRTTGALTKAFGLKNAPLLIQGFITCDGRFSVLEIAVRLGGGPSSFRTVTLKTGFDLIDATVDCFLGKEISQRAHHADSDVYASVNVYATSGELKELCGFHDLQQTGYIHELYQYKFPGYVFDDSISARNRVCAFIVKANTREQLFQKIKHIYQNIDVKNTKNTSILNRSVGFNTL